MSDKRNLSPTPNEIHYKSILETVMLIIENELFPIIGLPYETMGRRIIDIPNNLMDIRDTLKRLQTVVKHGNDELKIHINTSQEIQQELQNDLILEDIPQLFEH